MSVTIGIDFGTSFCSASWLNPATGKPEAVRFRESGSEKMPSVVAFTRSNKVVVGDAPYLALEDAATADEEERRLIQENTITGVKTRMRKGNKYLRPKTTYGDDDIISFILRKIKEQVQESCRLDGSIEKVVLTHPVVFEEWKKDCLKHAAALAGFKKVKLFEEPVSAALFAIKSGVIPASCKGLLVYDFGASTFDVAYVKIENDGDLHLPLAPQGDSNCGGDDIDLALYRDWEKYVYVTKGKHIISNPEEVDLAFLCRCRRQKEQLSRGQMADYISAYIPGVGNVHREFSETDFNRIIEPWIDKTISKTQQVFKDIQASRLPLDCAILIGGSSRLPMVQTKMENLLGSGVKVVTTGALDVAVAVGAMYSVETIVKKADVPAPPKIAEPTKHFCIYCGKPILSNEKFCMNCGKPNFSYRP